MTDYARFHEYGTGMSGPLPIVTFRGADMRVVHTALSMTPEDQFRADRLQMYIDEHDRQMREMFGDRFVNELDARFDEIVLGDGGLVVA